MEVILLQKVKNFGKLGDKVKVKPGFGRNFLLPQNMAVRATPENIEKFEADRAVLEKSAQQSFAKAEQRAVKISDISLVIEARASDEGKLYGSISATDICDALAKKSVEVSKKEIIFPEGSIHMTGDYELEVHLHPDVIANLKLQVKSA